MRIAYLVVAHNAPAQLGRLLAAIKSASADVFVHIDGKSDITAFTHLASPGVHFLQDRHPVYWGDFSQVEAILDLMRTALRSGPAYTRIILLSGADYPIRSTRYIEDFLREHPRTEFINIVDMPNERLGKPLSRVDTFWPRRSHFFWSRVEAKLRRAAVRFGLLKVERDHRKYLKGMTPCGGSQWWALTRSACEYVLEFVESHPSFMRFYANTVYPDELMIHTILGNSHFRPAVLRNLTYTHWPPGASSPAPIGEHHVREFAAVDKVMSDSAFGVSELLFARKFDADADSLIAQLDAARAEKDGIRAGAP